MTGAQYHSDQICKQDPGAITSKLDPLLLHAYALGDRLAILDSYDKL